MICGLHVRLFIFLPSAKPVAKVSSATHAAKMPAMAGASQGLLMRKTSENITANCKQWSCDLVLRLVCPQPTVWISKLSCQCSLSVWSKQKILFSPQKNAASFLDEQKKFLKLCDMSTESCVFGTNTPSPRLGKHLVSQTCRDEMKLQGTLPAYNPCTILDLLHQIIWRPSGRNSSDSICRNGAELGWPLR